MVAFGYELIVAIFLTGFLDIITAVPPLPKFCERDGRLFLERTHFRKKTQMGCENCYCPQGGGTPNCALVTCGIPFCAYGVEYKSDTCCPTCRKPGGNVPPLPPRLIAPNFDLDDLSPRPPGYNPWNHPRYYGPPSPPADPPTDLDVPPVSPSVADDSKNGPGPPAFDPAAVSGAASPSGHPAVYSPAAASSAVSSSASEPGPPVLRLPHVNRPTRRDYKGISGPPGSSWTGSSSAYDLAVHLERTRKDKKRPYYVEPGHCLHNGVQHPRRAWFHIRGCGDCWCPSVGPQARCYRKRGQPRNDCPQFIQVVQPE